MDAIIREIIAKKGNIDNDKIAKSMTVDHLFVESYFKEQINNYAKHTRIPLSVIDTDNHVRIMHQQTSFCNHILKSEIGKHLNNIGFINNKNQAEKDDYCIFHNEFGLITGIFPIIIHNTVTAYLYTGNIRCKINKREDIDSLALKIKCDKDTLWTEYQNLRCISYDDFEHYLLSLKLFIEQLSYLTFEKYKTNIFSIWNKSIDVQNETNEKSQMLLYENTSDAIFITKGDRILSFNPMAQHSIIMINSSDSEQYYLSDFVLPENINFIKDNIHKITHNEGFQSSFEIKLKIKDGSIKWYDVLILKYKYYAHNAQIYFLRNITKNKNTQKKLSERNLIRKAVIERSSQIILILNSKSKIIDYNQKALDILTIPLSNLKDLKIEQLLSKDLVNNQVVNTFYDAILNKSKGNLECICDFKLNSKNWVHLFYEPIYDFHNEFVGMQLEIVDIQPLKDIEKKKIFCNQIINEIIKVQNICIYNIDENRKIKFASKTTSKIFNEDANSLIGKRITDITTQFSDDCLNHLLICHENQQDSEFSYFIKDSKNSTLHFKAYAKNIYDENVYKGISLKCIDITKQKKDQDELLKREEEDNELFELSSTLNCILDTKGKCVKMNNTLKLFLGINKNTNLYDIKIKDYLKNNDELHIFISNIVKAKRQIKTIQQQICIIDSYHIKNTLEATIIPRYTNKTFNGFIIQLYNITNQITLLYNEKKKVNNFRKLFNNGEVLTVNFAKDMSFTRMNKKALEYFQLSKQTLNQLYFKDKLTSKEEIDFVYNTILETFKTGSSSFFETKLMRHDWKAIWHKCCTTAIYDNNGSIYEVMVQLMDITSNKLKEFELLDSKLLFQQLTNGGYTQIYKTDEDLNIIYINEPAEKFFNMPLKDMLGRFLPDLTEAKTKEAIILANKQQRRFTFEHEVSNYNGEIFWHKTTMCPLYNCDGKFIGNIFQCLNISDNIHKEQELEKSRSNFMALVNSGQTLILQYDHSHKLVYANDRARNFSRLKNEETSFIQISKYLSNVRDIVLIKNKLIKAIREKKATQYDIQLKRYDNSNRWFSVSITPHFDSNNFLITYFIEGIDITEAKEKQLQIELNEKFLSNIANIGTIQLYQLDANLHVAYANKEVLSFTNISLEKINEVYFPDLVNDQVIYYINETIRTKEKIIFEHEIADYTGKLFWHTTYMTPIIDSNNEFNGLIVQCSNISESKYARDKIEKSERRFKYLANSGDILIQEFSPDGICLYANEPSLKCFKLNDTIIGKHAQDIQFIDKIYETFNYKFTEIYLTRNTHFTFEIKIIKNETTVWLKCYCAPTVDGNGDYTSVLIQSVNITKIKKKETELMRQNILINNLKDNEYASFWILNKKGEYKFASKKLLNLTDYNTVDELNNHNQQSNNIFIEKQKWINEAMKGKPFSEYTHILTKEKEKKWFYTSIIPIINDNKEYDGLIGYSYDTTKLMNEKLEIENNLSNFYQLSNNISAILFQIDENGYVINISKNIYALSDRTFCQEDFIKKNVLDFKHPLLTEKLQHIWSKLNNNKGYFSEILFWTNGKRNFASRFNIVTSLNSEKNKKIFFGYIVDESKWMESKKVIDILSKIIHQISDKKAHLLTKEVKEEITTNILNKKYIHNELFQKKYLKLFTSLIENSKTSNEIELTKETLYAKDFYDLLKILELSSNAYLTYNEDFQIVYVNTSFQKLISNTTIYPKQSLYDIFENKEDTKIFSEFHKKLEKNPDTLNAIDVNIHPKDSIIPIHCVGQYQSKTKHYLLMLSNMKKTKSIELKNQELKKIQMHFNSIFQSPYLIINSDGKIIETSKLADSKLLENTKNIYRNIFEIINHDYKDMILKMLQKATLENNIEICNITINKYKEILYYQLRVCKMTNSNLDNRLILFFIDNSNEIKIQNHIIQNEKMVSLGEMTTAMIHEINQPLLSISLSLDNLFARLFKKAPEEIDYLKQKSNHIFSDIERIGRLIDHVRLFARSDNNPGAIATDHKKFGVNETVTNALSIISEQLKIYGFIVTLNLEKKIPDIYGNTYRLEQVILNFITNARDAINQKNEKGALKRKKNIDIKTYYDTKYVYISITDNGVGIVNEHKEKIFETFFSTKGNNGVGIGLSISKSIIDEFQGSIQIESDGDSFTTMIAKIPHDQKKNLLIKN